MTNDGLDEIEEVGDIVNVPDEIRLSASQLYQTYDIQSDEDYDVVVTGLACLVITCKDADFSLSRRYLMAASRVDDEDRLEAAIEQVEDTLDLQYGDDFNED